MEQLVHIDGCTFKRNVHYSISLARMMVSIMRLGSRTLGTKDTIINVPLEEEPDAWREFGVVCELPAVD